MYAEYASHRLLRLRIYGYNKKNWDKIWTLENKIFVRIREIRH